MTKTTLQSRDMTSDQTENGRRKLTQAKIVLRKAIDTRLLRAAWQDVTGRHEEYRLCRRGNGPTSSSSHQAVSQNLPWQEHDLRNIPVDSAQQWLKDFLEADRNQDIPVDRAPLMRCAVVRLDDQTFEMVWSYHPVLFNRDDARRVLGELAAAYESKASPESSATPDNLENSWASSVVFMEGRLLDPLGDSTERPVSSVSKLGTSDRVPNDDIEKRLIEIWQAVLGNRRVGIHDNFFDLGGHSLLAAKLLTRIEESFDTVLPFASFLETPTIEQQARLIRGNKNGTVSQQVDGALEFPFFLFGNSPTFRGLSQNLSAAGPVFSLGLQPSLIGDLKDPRSLTCMAEHFVGEIRKRQPAGPYFLGGWCAHGLLAFEAAQQLRAQGQQVGLLFLIESVHPMRRMEYPSWKRFFATIQLKAYLAQFELSYLRQLEGSQKRQYVMGRIAQKLSRTWRTGTRHLKFNRQSANRRDQADPLSFLYAAAARYSPAPYEGPVVLVRSLQRTFGFGQELRLGWDDTLGNQLTICETPGNHYTMYLKPHVDPLTREMIPLLQKAKQQSVGGPQKAA